MTATVTARTAQHRFMRPVVRPVPRPAAVAGGNIGW